MKHRRRGQPPGASHALQELFSEAVRYHQSGRLPEAEQTYRRILAQDPKYVTALNNLGLLLPPEEAMALFQQALSLQADYVDAHINLGNALQATGNIAEAIRQYRQAIALDPNRPTVHLVLGTWLQSQGDLQEALVAYRRALALKPGYVEASINLGAVLHAKGQPDEALIHYQRALALRPDLTQIAMIVGALFQAKGRHNEALAVYQQVIAAHPDHPDGYVNLGITLRAQRKHNDAMAQYQKTLLLQSDHPDALFGLAAVLQDQGRFEEALQYYERVLVFQPTHPELLFAMATAWHARGNVEEAVALYQRALVIKPDHVNAHNNLGAVLYGQGKVEEAIVHYEEGLRLDPRCAEVHNNLGDVFKDQKKFAEATEHYQEAIALKPDFGIALANLGIVQSIEGHFTPAEAWFRRALALDPTLDAANMNLASILERDGRLKEAQIYRSHALRPQPLITERAPLHRRTVLVLSAAGDGNVPIDTLIPKHVNTRITWNVECATEEQEEQLPAYDVIFNAIGNADLIPPSIPRIRGFMNRRRRKVLNPPECIVPTRRDRMPQLLAGIPNVVVPPVARIDCDAIVPAELPERLARAGITCPMIVRPISGQGGLGVVLVETPEQLAEMTFSGADVFYFIAYHDYRSQDGFYRKYRTIFVDRKAYPYHLAISPRWLVHYFSAEMLAVPWKHDEERRFLENPASALGSVVTTAVEAIGQRMNMDYAGIDYSILPDGQVLVFEANATMSAVLPDANEFPYKHQYVHAIFDAFDAMLERNRMATIP